jgi:hypothetical protein
MLLIKAQLIVWLHELQDLGKAKLSSVTRIMLATMFLQCRRGDFVKTLCHVVKPSVHSNSWNLAEAFQDSSTSHKCWWILLQHDNAQPHTSLTTEEAQIQMNWSSTPTTQPRSCSLRFGALKDAIHEKMFGTDGEVTEEVAASTQYIWCKKGIDGLVSCWHKAVECNGDYTCNTYMYVIILWVCSKN